MFEEWKALLRHLEEKPDVHGEMELVLAKHRAPKLNIKDA